MRLYSATGEVLDIDEPAPARAAAPSEDFEATVVGSAERAGIDPAIMLAMWDQESGRSTDVNKRGPVLPPGHKYAGHYARGPFQIMSFHPDVPDTFQGQSDWAANHLKERGVAGYYGKTAGGGSARPTGMPDFPSTNEYEAQVMARAEKIRQGRGGAPSSGAIPEEPAVSEEFYGENPELRESAALSRQMAARAKKPPPDLVSDTPEFFAGEPIQATLSPTAAEAPAAETGSWEGGWGAGWESAKGLGYLGLAAVGAGTGMESLRDWAFQNYQVTEEAAKQYSAGHTTEFTEIDSLASAGDWFVYNLATLAPFMIESLIGMAAGAMAGSMMAPGAGTATGMIGGLVARQAGKTLLKELTEKVGKEAAEKVVKEEMERAARSGGSVMLENALRTAAQKFGGTVGAMTTSYAGMATGDIYSEVMDEEGRVDSPALVFMAALPYAAVDAFGDMMMLGRIAKGTGGDKLVARLAKSMTAAGAQQGTEEVLQELNLMAAGLAEGKEYTSDQVAKRLINSFAAGAGGGLATGVLGAHRPGEPEEPPPPAQTDLTGGNGTDLDAARLAVTSRRPPPPGPGEVNPGLQTPEQRQAEIDRQIAGADPAIAAAVAASTPAPAAPATAATAPTAVPTTAPGVPPQPPAPPAPPAVPPEPPAPPAPPGVPPLPPAPTEAELAATGTPVVTPPRQAAPPAVPPAPQALTFEQATAEPAPEAPRITGSPRAKEFSQILSQEGPVGDLIRDTIGQNLAQMAEEAGSGKLRDMLQGLSAAVRPTQPLAPDQAEKLGTALAVLESSGKLPSSLMQFLATPPQPAAPKAVSTAPPAQFRAQVDLINKRVAEEEAARVEMRTKGEGAKAKRRTLGEAKYDLPDQLKDIGTLGVLVQTLRDRIAEHGGIEQAVRDGLITRVRGALDYAKRHGAAENVVTTEVISDEQETARRTKLAEEGTGAGEREADTAGVEQQKEMADRGTLKKRNFGVNTGTTAKTAAKHRQTLVEVGEEMAQVLEKAGPPVKAAKPTRKTVVKKSAELELETKENKVEEVAKDLETIEDVERMHARRRAEEKKRRQEAAALAKKTAAERKAAREAAGEVRTVTPTAEETAPVSEAKTNAPAFMSTAVVHTPRELSSIPSILASGLLPSSNVGIGLENQAYAGEVVLVFEPSSVATEEKEHNPNEATVTKKAVPKLIAFLINRSQLSETPTVDEDKLAAEWEALQQEWQKIEGSLKKYLVLPEGVPTELEDLKLAIVGIRARLKGIRKDMRRNNSPSVEARLKAEEAAELAKIGNNSELLDRAIEILRKEDALDTRFEASQTATKTKSVDEQIEDLTKLAPKTVDVYTYEENENGLPVKFKKVRAGSSAVSLAETAAALDAKAKTEREVEKVAEETKEAVAEDEVATRNKKSREAKKAEAAAARAQAEAEQEAAEKAAAEARTTDAHWEEVASRLEAVDYTHDVVVDGDRATITESAGAAIRDKTKLLQAIRAIQRVCL